MPFSTIVLARWSAGWFVAAAALTPALSLSAAIAGVPDAVGPMALSSIAGTAAYLALFVFIGAAVRRAAWWSLGIVLLGERLLGAVLTGIAQLSPQWLATMVYAGSFPIEAGLEREGMPTGRRRRRAPRPAHGGVRRPCRVADPSAPATNRAE